MKLYFFKPSVLLFIFLVIGCGKDDPKPLGAQTNAVLLAGEQGKSKKWQLSSIVVTSGSGTNPQPLDPQFTDNVYTFSNNDAQEYVANEGATKYNTTDPDKIESGTWAFTINGSTLLIEVDKTYSGNGLFSPEPLIYHDANGNPIAFPIGYPYPATISSLTANTMVLQMNNVVVSTTYKFTLTFTAI